MPQSKLIKRELLLEPPDPMRASMDEPALIELAHSLKDVGQLMPLLVTPAGWRTPDGAITHVCPDDGDQLRYTELFEIIDGHRRYLASAITGITELQCTVFENVEEAKFAMMVHANLMREDVTPAEEGIQYLTLAEKHGWGIEQLCRTFKRSEHYIHDRVALVQGDAKITQAVGERKINFGVAKVLLRCKDEAHRHYLLNMALTHGATVRTAEAWLASWNAQVDAAGGAMAPPVAVPSGPWTPPPPPECLWCLDNDDTQNMVQVWIHRYHLKELLRWLESAGVHPSQAAASPETPSTPPATKS